MTAPTSALRRLAASQTGTAAVEFALIAYLLTGVGLALVDLGYAAYVRMRLSNAVTAAALYAQLNGRSVTADTVAGFLADIRSVALEAAAPVTDPTITILLNDRPDTSAFGLYYCRASLAAAWSGTGSSALACGDDVSAGKFVTITVAKARPTLWARASLFGSIAQTSDSAVVRVQ